MATYYAVYILIWLIAVVFYGTKEHIKDRKKAICIACGSLLVLLFALRHPSMGIDLGYGYSYGYLGNYTKIANFSWIQAFLEPVSHYERGYILFNKCLSIFSEDHQFFLAGCALVSIAPIFYVIYKESDMPILSVCIFMGLPTFALLFSGMRQAIALGICFVALMYIKQKEPWKFIAAVLIANTFHDTAWIFLTAYPVYYFPMKKSWRIFTCLALPLIYVFRYPIFLILSKLFKDNAVADNNGAITLFIVFTLVYIFACLFSGENEETAGLKNLFYVACCGQALGGVYSTVLRVGYYFINSLILLLPLILFRMKNRSNALIMKWVIVICFVLFGLYSLRNGSWSMSYPYYWFWK